MCKSVIFVRMKKWFSFWISCLFCFQMVYGLSVYKPDLLGCNYSYRTFRMAGDGTAMRPICTLVKRDVPAMARTALLYVHGYNDYFFQAAMGDSIAAHGYAFFALDLRDYGRSIQAGREPFYTNDFRCYDADLDSALAAIRAEGYKRIVVMGHSTGGLIASDYLCRYGQRAGVSALILNSPFLDWNFGWWMERLVIPVVSWIGRLFPRLKVQGEGKDTYARSLLRGEKGEWSYNTVWKKPHGQTKRAGWIRAVRQAQLRVRRGSVPCPVLVMSSDRSLPETSRWNDAFLRTDIVLSVKDIQRYGKLLGSEVSTEVIVGGMHDLVLSERAVRDVVYRKLFVFMQKVDGR